MRCKTQRPGFVTESGSSFIGSCRYLPQVLAGEHLRKRVTGQILQFFRFQLGILFAEGRVLDNFDSPAARYGALNRTLKATNRTQYHHDNWRT